jgi:hypothetical protein
MKSIFKKTLMAFGAAGLAAISFGGASGPDQGPKLLKINDYNYLNVNTINTVVNSNGTFVDATKANHAGMEWPKGSGKTCVYSAGLWIAGKHQPDGIIRTANMDQKCEYQPGPLLETFNTTTNDDALPVSRASDPRYHLYKIDKSDLKAGAAANPDLTNWPGDLGAPYIDVNGNGKWDPGIDQPKFYGDQQLWTVVNDVTRVNHAAVGTTSPMGMEVRCLYFAFNQPGAIGNIAFLKWQILNKSDADYDSVYVSMWSDVDLGDGNDDLPGCDTTLSLGYVYNGDNDDGTAFGYGSNPPSDGYDFFEGPKVPAGPADSALVDGAWIKGYVNLPMTSFVVYTNGKFASIVDPSLLSSTYPSVAYDYMKGWAGTVHQQLISKITGKPLYKWFSGDPVAGTGELPTNFPLGTFGPQDIRIMLSSGPFTLAQGDTQEVVGAFLIAQGGDRLKSVTLLKSYDVIAQSAFNHNFVIPSAPPPPNVEVTQLPNQLVFDWTNGAQVPESYLDYNNDKFEGYNFYQGASVNGPWTRLATYDLIDSVTTIDDYYQDPTTGGFYIAPKQFGTDSGLKHFFIADQDYLTGNPLVNGKQYFYALTTYTWNITPDALAKGVTQELESAKDAITVIPQQPAIGTSIPGNTRSILPTSRGSDDAFQPEVINPGLLNNGIYTVTLEGSGTTVTSWSATRILPKSATVDTVVKSSTYFGGDNNSPYIDGLLLKLSRPIAGLRLESETPNGWNYSPSYDQWFGGQQVYPLPAIDSSATSGGLAYPETGLELGPAGKKASTVTPDKLLRVQLRFDRNHTQHAYRFVGNLKKGLFANPPQDSSFTQWIKTPGVSGVPYQGDYASISIPVTAWSVDPFNGDSLSPRQLNVAFIEWNDSLWSKSGKYLGRGNINGQWDPTTDPSGGNEILLVFRSTYSDTAQTKYTKNPKSPANPLDIAANMDSVDVMYAFYVMRTSRTADFKNGDVLTIKPHYTLVAGRQWSFTAAGITSGNTSLMKDQLNLINVFPNPYFGHNIAESGLFNRWVTFSHLPAVAHIKVFTITGELVRAIDHSDNTTFERWDLRNTNGLPAASGVYLVYIEIPGVGNRILKLAVVQPEDRPSRI